MSPTGCVSQIRGTIVYDFRILSLSHRSMRTPSSSCPRTTCGVCRQRAAMARRLTSNLGAVTSPMLSHDGTQLAFVGREEGGPEVYVMPADGGSARRLTYFNSNCRVVGWTPDDESILFASSYGQVNSREMALVRCRAQTQRTAQRRRLPFGPAQSVSYRAGRCSRDRPQYRRPGALEALSRRHDRSALDRPQRRRRVRATAAGPRGQYRIAHVARRCGASRASTSSATTRASAICIAVCRMGATCSGIRTTMTTMPAIQAAMGPESSTMPVRISSCSTWPPTRADRVDVQYRSPRVHRNRRFVDSGKYMDGFELHPSGKALAMTTRGKVFAFYNHEGSCAAVSGSATASAIGTPRGWRTARDLAVVTDEPGEETLEVHGPDPTAAAAAAGESGSRACGGGDGIAR